MTVEAPRAVVCGECGSSFDLSARNVRAARQRGEEPLCAECRRPPKEQTPAEREKLKRWWLEKSGLELVELRELAFALWPELAGDRQRLVLAVASDPD